MKSFPRDIQFCYSWRSYQADVLRHLDKHLENRHLHLVAPPGSGKTVLGLEVILRLDKPTLIVAPTLAIRNQWAHRFTELFLQQDQQPDWISTDIKNPSFMTITTYQGLYALFQDTLTEREESKLDDLEEEDIPLKNGEKHAAIERLFEQKFQTFVLDEAHHLRTNWWKTTMHVRNQLDNPAVIALTATPPYDVGKAEWDKYIELCGPIDEEIEVAALVKEGDLCPHQDYLWMSPLTPREKEPIDVFHQEAEQVRADLLKSQAFQALIENHPWILSADFVEEKLASYSCFISLIVYLKQTGSSAWEKPFQIMEEKASKLPSFDMEWTEELLSFLLYRDKYVDPKEEPLKSIKKKLSSIGVIERRRVKLIATRSMQRTLLHSASKLDSIVEIVKLEKDSQQDALRLVVLADYIYQEDLPQKVEEQKPLIRLGVVPIFEKLRRNVAEDCRLGVLTGSVVIVPNEAVSFLERDDLQFTAKKLVHDDRYSMITWKGTSRQEMVKVMTEIFASGEIDVLVGTTALLGEGWDAPSVNTLILASYVGSFMLTNQMRGRAIRAERGNEQKAANIWHLVCVDTQAYDGGYDYESLTRRFQSLSGVDAELPIIQSGIDRLSIAKPPFKQKVIKETNEIMLERARDRLRLFEKWQEAVHKGEKKREEVEINAKQLPPIFVLRNTLKSLFIICAAIFLNVFYTIGEYGYYYESIDEIRAAMIWGLLIGFIISSPFWWRALRIFLFNSSIESRMKQVAEAIYDTLFEIGLLETPLRENKIIINKGGEGSLYGYLEQGRTQEQKVFLQAVQQLVDPIDNPRYLLHRRSGKHLWVRHDYHAIPEEISRKKEYVDIFLKKWNKRIGKGEAIFTRTPEGRRLLLKARLRATSGKFIKRSERKSIWK
ncbi:Helicase conserved C-terminal domain-containing protein [Gracilibacillus ureilyticus]|uniref:Helicase conserved C-terminal domain-containing protein n=1 Tax=Gracilibacillus ureilyticus TaxID=531814 RepID=A0A1H9UK91_9BACI|nr:DEAD/DEAH box helicase family protein [Gracilibacillus ureilyticus]SES09711.1 Helicase conserved C-terminal domain-containing protein [Gracilibacillus ureilyticus]